MAMFLHTCVSLERALGLSAGVTGSLEAGVWLHVRCWGLRDQLWRTVRSLIPLRLPQLSRARDRRWGVIGMQLERVLQILRKGTFWYWTLYGCELTWRQSFPSICRGNKHRHRLRLVLVVTVGVKGYLIDSAPFCVALSSHVGLQLWRRSM